MNKRKQNKKKESCADASLPPFGSGRQMPDSIASISSFEDADLISNGRLLNILNNDLGPLMTATEFPLRTTLADNEYLETSPEFVIATIITDPILSAQSYHADIFDCDDYVLYLKTKLSLYAACNQLRAPLAVGYLFTTIHAFTFCIGAGSQLFLINTQSSDHAVTGDPLTFGQFISLGPGNKITTIYI
jgi:hypothetical protein